MWATGQIDDDLRQKLEFVLEKHRVHRARCQRELLVNEDEAPRFHLSFPNEPG